MGKEGAHVQHARRRVGRPPALPRPPGDRFGGREDWNGEARSKQNGRREEGVTGSPTATVAVAACSTSAPLSGGGAAAAARWHRLLETTATAPGFSFVILWCSRRKGGRESLDRNVGSLFSKVRTPLRTILFFSIESCRLYTCRRRRRRQRGLGWLGGRAPPHFCPKTTLVMPTWFEDGRTNGRTRTDLSLIPLLLVAPSFPHTAIPRPTCCAAARPPPPLSFFHLACNLPGKLGAI